jgi:uncharacterized phiE125 gp8 family phage protein
MYGLTLITAPTGEPLTVDEVITQLRLPEEESEDYISGLITIARQHFEEHDDRRLCTQTWKLTLDHFPYYRGYSNIYPSASYFSGFELPLRPVQVVNSLKYCDTDGILQTLDPALYEVDLSSFIACVRPIYGGSWPSTRFQKNAVEIEFVVGYGDAVSTPDPVFDGTNYNLTLTPSWLTTTLPSAKTTAGFHIEFGTVSPASATLEVLAQAGTPLQQLAHFTADIDEAVSEADIAFPATLAAPATLVGGIPKTLKQALLLLIGHFYENREETIVGGPIQNIPMGYQRLVGANRRMNV